MYLICHTSPFFLIVGVVLRGETRTSVLVCKSSTTELYPYTKYLVFTKEIVLKGCQVDKHLNDMNYCQILL